MNLIERRHALSLLGTGLLCAAGIPSHSQNFYFNDATVNSAISGNAIVGKDGNGHNSSPHFNFLTGGSLFNGALDSYNASVVNMSGGLIPHGLTTHDSSSLNFTSGTIEFGLTGNDNSAIIMSGGTVFDGVAAGGNAKMTISGGDSEGFTLDSSSQPLDITGGLFKQSLNAFVNSVVNIRGGDFSISGGLYGSDSSVMNFYGTGLSSVLTDPNNGGYSLYTLSGKLQDGTTANGLSVGMLNGSGATFHLINLTPEPGAVSLLAGLGMTGAGVLLRRLRRARRTV